VKRVGLDRDLYHVVTSLRLSTPETTVQMECGEDALCVLDVRGTYRWLAARASSSGARIALASTAEGTLTDTAGAVAGCRVRDASGSRSIHARVVVDAGGHRAQMSKHAELHPGFKRFGVGAEWELAAPKVDQDELVLILSERHAPSGYAWAFPWGEDRVRLGVGVHHSDVRSSPREHLEELREDAGIFGLDLSEATAREFHYGLVPAAPVASPMAGDGIVAVGDAAGQATLVVGEGIRIALVAGEMAGETVAAALKQGRTDQAALAPYEERFRREFGRDLKIGYQLNRRLSSYRDAQWNKRLLFLETMPPSLVLDLLQSRVDLTDIATWAIRHPRQWRHSGALVRALASSLR
jgi:digeranylgeranylglycerophospholipid reductase